MISEKLRELADEADREQRRLTLPRERYTLAQALAAVKAACPGKSVCIDLAAWDYSHGGHDVEWSVYDGITHFKGSTLTAAVMACLAAHAPKPADVLADIEATLGIEATPDDVVPIAEGGESTLGEPATTVLG